jgi:c-di-GMP phosphodiesterase
MSHPLSSTSLDKMLTSPSLEKYFIGRQPIFDTNNHTIGYELLFRSSSINRAQVNDPNKATLTVINNALIEFGLTDLVDDKLAFINITADCLLNGTVELLPKDRVILEILETEVINDELMAVIISLMKSGHRFALDDFIDDPARHELSSMVEIVKIDVRINSSDEIRLLLDKIKRPHVKLLAEKIESHEEYMDYKAMGFDYFQGYYFEKPRILNKDKIPDNHIALLRLVAALQDPKITVTGIEFIMSQTVSLNFKILRFINSAYVNLPTKVSSIRQAVIYFGIERLRQLATILVINDMSDKPHELINTGLIRAKMCELLATCSNLGNHEEYYMTGLFSILEPLLDYPLNKIIESMPLSSNVKDALTVHSGLLGEALQCCLDYEQCQWDNIQFYNLNVDQIIYSYSEAVSWSRQMTTNLRG